ncbi:ABC transporter permease [Nocardia mexicana]|uniref:ABC-2 type transport system permease protein n=1 Tax=Nocardia mexicana TaxID=279262 RepID=A0A370GMB5_9NOCA|nr:ABC transporter permease [Nocardia mexicana]RDI44416.1 ABC-2 type transport system permease protein [Nocardia mexicana]
MTVLTSEMPRGRYARTRRSDTLTGTATLIRFMLRRDRIKLPAWILGITVMSLYYGSALPQVYKTEEDLKAVSSFAEGTTGALISGPGYGLAHPTVESVIVAVYGLYFLLLAALMNILLISRHTRVEEQTGRAELVRANVVGRYAPLTAALVVALGANVVLSLFVAASFPLAGLEADGALLFGAGVGAVGLVFAAITAVTVQITEYSRAASGLAGAALGVAYVVRAAGDSIREGGSALSWLSPLAWSQQTRAYSDPRWWPLVLSLVFAGAAVALGYALSSRRDLDAGLVAARRGSPRAALWLNSPVALAFRLQRASLIGWGCALAAMGLLYGALTKTMVDSFADLPDQVVEVFGGDTSRMLDGYISTMAIFDALLVVIFAILGVQSLRGEETRGRAEPVLATGTGRWALYGSWIGVLAVGAAALLLVTGLALGISSAISIGDGTYLWKVIAAHLVYLPAVLVVLGVAALLFGVVPAAVGAAWALFGFSMILGFFGPIMDLPQAVMDLSPFEHAAGLPLEPMTWLPMVVLTLLAAALAGIGGYGFRRRDLDMK